LVLPNSLPNQQHIANIMISISLEKLFLAKNIYAINKSFFVILGYSKLIFDINFCHKKNAALSFKS